MITTDVHARILVVEDDAIVAMDIEHALESMGYEVVALAGNAADALRLARSREPDLVLMDIRMPGPMDGVDAAATIEAELSIPVVFLTAHSDARTLERAKATGSWGYVVKPFDVGGLRAAVEMAIHRHRATQLVRESEGRFRTTLSSLSDAVIVTDDRGAITYLNAAATYLLARPRAELEGYSTTRVIHIQDDQGKVLPNPVAQALESGRPVHLSGRNAVRLPGGRTHPVRGSATPIRGEGGRQRGAVLVLSDAQTEGEPQRLLHHRAEA